MTIKEMNIESIGNLNRFNEVVATLDIAVMHIAANRLGIVLFYGAKTDKLAEQIREVAYRKGCREGCGDSHKRDGHYFSFLGMIAEELIAIMIGSSQKEVGDHIAEEMEAMRYGEDGEQISYEPYSYHQPLYAVGTLFNLLCRD